MSHLIDIFLQPGKVFQDLRENPRFWLPLLLLAVFSAVFPLWYFMTVDAEWFQQHSLLAAGAELSAAEIEQAGKVMPGVQAMAYIGAISSLMLTNVDPLLVQLPADSPWLGLARGFSLLNFWSWFLLALGWRTMTNAGWLQSIVVALLPSVVIYGVMALFALT